MAALFISAFITGVGAVLGVVSAEALRRGLERGYFALTLLWSTVQMLIA